MSNFYESIYSFGFGNNLKCFCTCLKCSVYECLSVIDRNFYEITFMHTSHTKIRLNGRNSFLSCSLTLKYLENSAEYKNGNYLSSDSNNNAFILSSFESIALSNIDSSIRKR